MEKEKDQALGSAVAQIERQFGKGSIMRMGDAGAMVDTEAVPTGALALDIALGIGGIPRGRIVEIFGPESSGKTTLLYHVIAQGMGRMSGYASSIPVRDRWAIVAYVRALQLSQNATIEDVPAPERAVLEEDAQ